MATPFAFRGPTLNAIASVGKREETDGRIQLHSRFYFGRRHRRRRARTPAPARLPARGSVHPKRVLRATHCADVTRLFRKIARASFQRRLAVVKSFAEDVSFGLKLLMWTIS